MSDFNELAGALEQEGYQVIGVEFRGVSGSTLGTPAKNFTLFDLAVDVRAAVLAAGVDEDEDVRVIGHAFGNRVARAYASAYPNTVPALVLVASGGAQNIGANKPVATAMTETFDWRLSPSRRAAAVKYGFFADENSVPTHWRNGWYRKAAALQIRAVRATPLNTWHAGGGIAPMLVLQASSDRIAPAEQTSAKLLAEFPDRVQVVTITPAGHALLPEKPVEISTSVIAFLNQIDR